MSASPERFGWADVTSTEAERSLAFYVATFGWTHEPLEIEHPYAVVRSRGVAVAGFDAIPDEKGPPEWTSFVVCVDTRGIVDRMLAAGGTQRFGPEPMGEYGVFALVRDPAGITIGVWQPQRLELPAPDSEGRLVRAQLRTGDVEGAVAFLTAVFGWTAHAAGRGEPVELRADGELTATVSESDAAHPPGWLPVLAVADPQAVTAAALAAGGEVDADGVIADPLGARFVLAAAGPVLPRGVLAAPA